MSDKAIADSEAKAAAAAGGGSGLSVGLFVIFAMMAWLVVVSVAYAASMIGFLADDGWFLSYGSLCSTVPLIAGLDRFAPFLLAGLWLGAIYLGLARNPAFGRVSVAASLVSIVYGAANVIAGPFTFRVGPAEVDPSELICGRWPREVTQRPDLDIMRMDLFGMPIAVFALSLVLLGLTIYVYLRVSRRVQTRYRGRAVKPA